MKKKVFGKLSFLREALAVSIFTIVVAGCMPAAKKVALPPVDEPPAREVEVVVAAPLPVEEPAQPKVEEQTTLVTQQPSSYVFEAPEPQVVVEEKLVLPDGEMFAARYRYYAGLEESYQALVDYLDWFSPEEETPELENCLLLIANIMEGYDGAMALLQKVDFLQDPDAMGELQPWQVVWRDISFIQGDCQSVYDTKSASLVDLLQRYDRPTAQIPPDEGVVASQAMDDKAIESYRYLMDNFPRWKDDPTLLTKYGQALLRRGRLQEAGEVFLQVLSEKDYTIRNLTLRRTVADILLTTGRQDEAMAQYRKLADIEQSAAAGKEITAAHLALLEDNSHSGPLLNIYRSFLREYYSFDGREISSKTRTAINQLESFYSGSPLTEHARTLLAGMEKTARQTVEEQIAVAGRLAEDKQFDKAINMLNALLQDNLPADLAEAVHYKLQEMTFDAEEEQKTQAWAEREQLAGRWQRAQDLFDRHQYDAAIELYETFAGTVYEEEAASQAQKAIDEAAGDLRKQAATLFLKARKENDDAKRAVYLHESLDLLKQVEEKYPETAIYEKVMRNMVVLEKEIAVLEAPAEVLP